MQNKTAWTAGGIFLVSATLASVMTVNADSFQQVDAKRAAAQGFGADPPVRLDYLPRDPVVIYNQSGATLLGQVSQQLTLYDDGTIVCSEVDPLIHPGGIVETATLEPGAVRWFLDELILWGAHNLEDDTTVAFDVPMATMTMLFKDRNGKVEAHTFSYYPVAAEGNAAEAERVVQAFIAEYFAAGSDSDWTGIDPSQRQRGEQGIDPTQRGRKAAEIEPMQRGQQSADEIDATQRGNPAADEVDATLRGKKAAALVDPTLRGNPAADEVDATLRGKKAANLVDPSQRGAQAAYEFVPKKRGLDAGDIDPSRRGRRAQHIDPAKR